MAEIRQIKVGGTTYDVADGVAREGVTAIQDALVGDEPVKNPLTVAISVNKGGPYEVGTSEEITYTFSAKHKGNAVTAQYFVDGNVVSNPYKRTLSATTKVTVKGEYSYKFMGVDVKVSDTEEKTIYFYKAFYMGFSDVSSADNFDYTTLVKQQIKSSPAGNYSVVQNTSGHYFWICIPDTMSLNTAIKQQNGFDFATVELLKTANGYKYYRSPGVMVPSSIPNTWAITIK